SYGIYLWHWPVVALMRPGVDVRWTGPGVVVAQAAIVLAAAALSFRYVEQPIRTGSLQRRLAQHPRTYRLELIGASAFGLVSAFALLFVVPKALNPVSSYVSPTQATAAVKPSQTSTPPQQTTTGQAATTSVQKLHALPAGRILALGDSVMLDCSSEVKVAL